MPTMRAAIATAQGIAFHNDVPRPVPGDNDVLVKVAVAGVNRADLNNAKATATSPFLIVGQDWAGEVVEVGKNVKGIAKGQMVMCFGRNGGYAEYAVTDAGWAMPFNPREIKIEQAGTLPLSLMTAHDALKTHGQLTPEKKVLVQGASSGVGILALQMARAMGATMIAGTSRDESKYPRLAALGATLMLNPNKPEWSDELLKATDNKGVDVVIDFVSGATVSDSMKACAVLARMVNVGRLGGTTANVNCDMHATKRITYTGVSFRTRNIAEISDIFTKVRTDVLKDVVAGRIALPIDRTFKLEEASAAHTLMNANGQFGKIAIMI